MAEGNEPFTCRDRQAMQRRLDAVLEALMWGVYVGHIPIPALIDEIMGRTQPHYIRLLSDVFQHVSQKEVMPGRRAVLWGANAIGRMIASVLPDRPVRYETTEDDMSSRVAESDVEYGTAALTVENLLDYCIETDNEMMVSGIKAFLLKRVQRVENEDQYRLIDKCMEYLYRRNAPRGKSVTKNASPHVFRNALLKLMELQDEEGRYCFCKKAHWMAVFRVAIDRGLAFEGDLEHFGYFIKELGLPACRVELSLSSLTKAYEGIYMKPLMEWTVTGYVRKKNDGKKSNLKPFDDMKCLADHFVALLDG